MKTEIRIFIVVLLVVAAVSYGPFLAAAQEENGDYAYYGAPDMNDSGDAAASSPLFPVGYSKRGEVTYMLSMIGQPYQNAATAISITNHHTASCSTVVEWKYGLAGVACTTYLTLGPGQTGEHCSRGLPMAITSCNATCSPALTYHEGSAIVGSKALTGCEKMAVSARTIYTNPGDTYIQAITDAKYVKPWIGNSGD